MTKKTSQMLLLVSERAAANPNTLDEEASGSEPALASISSALPVVAALVFASGWLYAYTYLTAFGLRFVDVLPSTYTLVFHGIKLVLTWTVVFGICFSVFYAGVRKVGLGFSVPRIPFFILIVTAYLLGGYSWIYSRSIYDVARDLSVKSHLPRLLVVSNEDGVFSDEITISKIEDLGSEDFDYRVLAATDSMVYFIRVTKPNEIQGLKGVKPRVFGAEMPKGISIEPMMPLGTRELFWDAFLWWWK